MSDISDKPFSELTTEEATKLARTIVRSSNSEEKIRERLTEAGFSGETAAVATRSAAGGLFDAMVVVSGPKGEIIHV